MLIALNIGNSHISFGGFNGDDLVFVASIATDEKQTGEQYACVVRSVFSLYGVTPKSIEGLVMSSVVPAVTPTIQAAFRLLCGCPILSIGSGVRTGLNIRIDQPRALGQDLVADAVCALSRGELPCVVVDLGTAITFTVLNGAGVLVGTSIAAGMTVSLAALKQRAAQLPTVQPAAPEHVIGRNTITAMQSGAVYGAAAMIDGMVDRIADELGEKPKVLVTGGSAETVLPLLRTEHTYLPHAALHGLRAIWQKNRQ